MLVVAVDDHAQALQVVHAAREHFPHLAILARTRDRVSYHALVHAGTHYVMRETLASAYETGISARRALGVHAYTAQRLGARWRRHEKRELDGMSALNRSNDEDAYVDRTRRGLAEAERLMRDEDPRVFVQRDVAWDPTSGSSEPSPS